MIQFQKNLRTDGRTDRPYFTGPFRPRSDDGGVAYLLIWSKEKKGCFSKQLERFLEIFLFDSFALNDLVVDVLELKLQSVQGVLLLEMSINQKAYFLLINLCEKNPPPPPFQNEPLQVLTLPSARFTRCS